MGTIDPAFTRVAERFPRAIRSARGGALAIYHRAELVLDVWTGARTTNSDALWERDTAAMAWSATKGVTSLAAHVLIERGLLALDEPVATWWPEFSTNGKESLTLDQVLAQEAGLHDIRHLVPHARSLLEHDQVARALANATPAYEPGAASSYHALTYGYLIDELVRRVTGRTLSEFVEDEVARPLSLDGFAIGSARVTPQDVAPPPTLADASHAMRRAAKCINAVSHLPPVRVDLRTIASAFVPPGGELLGTPSFLDSANGSIGGVFTARSLARFYAALITPGGLDGVMLWTSATRERATLERTNRRDLVLSVRPRWSYESPGVVGFGSTGG